MKMRWLSALIIANLACVAGNAPAPAHRPVSAPKVVRGAASIAADSARERLKVADPPRGVSWAEFWSCSTLARGTTLTGRVVEDYTGRPAAGIGVSVAPGCIAWTDAEGRYAMGPFVPAAYRVRVLSDRHHYPGQLVYLRDTAVTFDFHVTPLHCRELGPTGALSGLVLDDSTGNPVEGAEVKLSGASCLTLTARDGRFTITGIPAGRHELVVRRLGYSALRTPHHVPPASFAEIRVRLQPAGRVTEKLYDFLLPPSCSVTRGSVLTGRVIDDSTSRAVAGVGVSVLPGCVVLTDAEGRYTLGPLAWGRYTLAVQSDGYYQSYRPTVNLQPDSISVRDIRVAPMHCTAVRPATRLFGIVLDDSTGNPVEAAQVQIPGTPCGAMTDVDGRFSIVGVPAGLHKILIRRIGYSVIELPRDIPAGTATELRVRMRRASTRLEPVKLLPGTRDRPPADSARSP